MTDNKGICVADPVIHKIGEGHLGSVAQQVAAGTMEGRIDAMPDLEEQQGCINR
jgi:hypothetical protein